MRGPTEWDRMDLNRMTGAPFDPRMERMARMGHREDFGRGFNRDMQREFRGDRRPPPDFMHRDRRQRPSDAMEPPQHRVP